MTFFVDRGTDHVQFLAVIFLDGIQTSFDGLAHFSEAMIDGSLDEVELIIESGGKAGESVGTFFASEAGIFIAFAKFFFDGGDQLIESEIIGASEVS